MNKFTSYLHSTLATIYDHFYRDKETIILSPHIIKILENDKEEIYSPEVINYLISKHMGELEYSFLVKNYIWHYIKMGKHQYQPISKLKFVEAIENAYKDGEMQLFTYLKTSKLRNSITFEAFLKEHKDDIHTFIRTNANAANNEGETTVSQEIIKKEKINVPVSALIELLLLPYQELEQILKQEPYGLSKEEFAYMVLSFFKLEGSPLYKNETRRQNMFVSYRFPAQIVYNVNQLEKSIDVSIVEEEIQGKPNYLDYIEVSEDLWKQVTSKIPSEFDDLEKAYYVYYQLCKTMTYYFSYFKVAETKKKSHIAFITKMETVSQIDSTNNSVVCYQLMSIYEKFLEHLKIPFDINDGHIRGRRATYIAHPNINMAVSNKYFIEADPLYGVIKGDMPLAKENRPLNGFRCKNNSEQVQKDFQASLDKVNSYIWQEEKNQTSFFDVVNAYRSITNNPFELEPAEKLSIIINSITQTNLQPTDTLVYISELTKMLFPDGSCTNYLILDHQQDMADDEWKTTGIPALQIVLAYQDPKEEEPRYYLYSKETSLTQKTHDEIQQAFNSERYEYLKRYKKDIPNIIVPEKGDKPYA